MFYWFWEWKLYVETNRRAMPKSKIYKTPNLVPPQKQNSLWNSLLCCLAHTDQSEKRRTKLKVNAYVLEAILIVNRKRPVKKVPTYYFVSAQGKTETTGGSQLMTCSRAGANDTSLWIPAKQMGEKVWVVWIAKAWWQEKTWCTPLFCRKKNPCKLDGEKNNCELLMMISHVTRWGY